MATASSCRILLLIALFRPRCWSASGLEDCFWRGEPCLEWQEDGALHFLQTGSSRSLEWGRIGQSHVQPAFTIDLDLPPRDRFRELARWKASASPPDDPAYPLASDGSRYDPVMHWINTTISELEQREWLELVKSSISDDYLEEMLGAEEEFEVAKRAYGRDLPYATTVDRMLLMSILYELDYPNGVLGCSGLLVALPNGTVIHGRNLDWYIEDFSGNNNATQQLTFMRGGVPIFTSLTFSCFWDLHTALRFGGWSIELNTHLANDRLVNLASAKAGGKFAAWEHRRLMEAVPDFGTAVSHIRETRFLAPQYMISAGVGPNEGTVVTFDREHVKDAWAEAGWPSPMVVERSLAPRSGTWYLAQTNEDAWAVPFDGRRVFEQQRLEALGRAGITAEGVMELLRTPPARENNTIFSWVMVPATNFTHLITSNHVSEVVY